ncbi:hypothetical protein BSKO_12606 [Bryopsis sp. KO-2023]|nr:hypothetical protein BSKO_12606 [Bryopsis sp. KO-2023]
MSFQQRRLFSLSNRGSTRLGSMSSARTSRHESQKDFSFWIDRGGTFTDVFAEVPAENGSSYRTLKLLSEDPAHYRDAPLEGIRRVLEETTGAPHSRDTPLDTSRIKSIRMGTTVATNALLERKGEPMAIVVTKGFQDLLHIGNQSRPNIFDLEVKCPDVLYECVVQADEQIALKKFMDESLLTGNREVKAVTNESGIVRKEIDLEKLKKDLQVVLDKGISSIAVFLKHAALFPEHEVAIGKLAAEMGFTQISLSHEVMQMVKMVPRGFTASADAYLTPCIQRYLNGFRSGFDEGLKDVQLLFMQSDGGLAQVDDFSGHKAILSGPAGGYVGYAGLTKWEGTDALNLQVIGFDMGGTSTDVSRFDGEYAHVFESVTAGVAIQAPQLDINTVAAGGGSRLFFRTGVFLVGPESAGAHPGPVCYRKGGPLTITDANAVLGRIVPDFFPKIFGPNEDEPLDVEGAREAMQKLTDEINAYGAKHGQPEKSVEQVAMGFIKVANETMSRPIRALTQMKGHDIQKHVLSCFGGAGGQHACSIARSLGIPTVFVHKYSSILSAVGMGVADVVHEEQKPFNGILGENQGHVVEQLELLESKAVAELKNQGFTPDAISTEKFLNLRYNGTDIAVMIKSDANGDYLAPFVEHYQREFGFVLSRKVLIDDVRVRAAGRSGCMEEQARSTESPGPLPKPSLHCRSCFDEDGFVETPVFKVETLMPGHTLEGPALLIDKISTVVVDPGCVASITAEGNILIQVAPEKERQKLGVECEPIQLAIFIHRFMSIAEQMGYTLQRTSVSVNIKERLDYSCALFGPDGSLVANAPHIPVHLGAMSEAVKFQVKYWGKGGPGESEGIRNGDVLVSNHPQLAGGSHLPDITVITPVFSGGQIVFFVASRGHHADIGGITPGSMPPNSKSLVEEGASIVSFKLVRVGSDGKGVFQEEGITEILMAPGKSGIEGVSGTRALEDNLSDLRAQVAANNQGITLVGQLIEACGLDVVQAYMRHIQQNAEDSVREMLKEFSEGQNLPPVGMVSGQDQMDDGSPIKLAVTIDRNDGSAIFDFEGTGPEVFGNCNAPPAVTYSAILYSLRCLVNRDIPLNQGCLAPVSIKIPEGCLLAPSKDAGVCGGNTLTCQRVTDVVLKAFKAAAASQGCMNNFTFGDETMGYYETIAGGSGAGPKWHGRSGVHTHMTNTRITDPEILEQRYPVLLHAFHLREGSGGQGQWRGGNGIIREVEFLRKLSVGILSERRSTQPFGLEGGGPGEKGSNILIKKDGRKINLGAKATVSVEPGDRFRIHTPGGGGYGNPDGISDPKSSSKPEIKGVKYRSGGGSIMDYKLRQESA